MKESVTSRYLHGSVFLGRLPGNLITIAFLLLSISFLSLPLHAQNNITVRGVITSNKGEAVPTASVSVKGTSKGVTSDANGQFEIAAPGNATLVISSVGFSSQEVKINNRTSINVILTAENKELEQVVVVGYGTQRKEAVTGSVASIGGDVMRDVPAPNIAQALQGRLAGVDMTQTSTKPGASMQIRIRGTRSLTASNDPLVVLDGIPFPGSIADLNPNDIKSIEILKDASATAIYGSRGANGVILVTTNKGQRGQKPRISYNAYHGAQTVFAKYPMMNAQEFIALRKAAGQYTNGVDEADSINTDWQDMFYRTGAVTSHDLGLSGGTQQGNYNFGMGYYQNQGVIPTQQYKRYSLRGSIDQQVGKFFRFGFTTNNNYNISEGNQVGLYGVLSMSPIANPYNTDGTLKRTVKMPLDEQWVSTRSRIEDLQDQWLNETRGYATYNAIYGEVKIPWIDGLKYRTNLGLDFIQNNNGNYTGKGINSTTATTPSTAGISNSQTYHWTLENLLSYDRTFAQKHTVNVVALYSAEQNKYNRSSMSAKDIPSDAFQFYNLGQATGEITVDPNNQDYQLWGLMSWMGRVMYSYDNRYMLSATLRSDGSSRLAEGHKWHTYPAVSAGWNIGNESFMKGISVINKLKLRAGFGQTSNQAISPYATLGRLSTRPYNFGPNNYAVGYYVSQLPNDNLGWEYSVTGNYGLDFAVLNNRLSGTVEYYVTNTKDILLGVSLPSTSGVTSYTANIGETQNKGWEFSLNGTILDNHNGWTWDAGVNLYTNRNKLVALASGQTRDEGNAWFVGHNINAIYDYEKVGLWQEKDQYRDVLEPGGNVGMIKVKYTGDYDANGKPTRAIGPSDRQVMDVDPDFLGGFNTRVAYKGFDLSTVAAFKSGGILVSTLYGSSGYLNMMSGRRGNVKVDYWTPENTDAKYPKPGGLASGDNPKYGSTLGYFDASYLKIRTISLGYDFNQSLIKNQNVKMRMYFTVQNPFVLISPYHKESGMDPETNSLGNENAAVTTAYQSRILTIGTNSPSTRNYVVGLNLTF
ncbi:TonB-dependent receptor [Chitinophagaceae bacterium LB-8]|uniref:TonB-dependent receptor n=1 Tax=Paraflavisolibacter caeni TaxID=2982496 RepID=A0A9X2XP75_9BACT|nr:TonB-dependent receptor [Paraflavisolibacter caeni]MCU7550139.1 TonB-dependent receptor [Paraflavisolibacter caeni]